MDCAKSSHKLIAYNPNEEQSFAHGLYATMQFMVSMYDIIIMQLYVNVVYWLQRATSPKVAGIHNTFKQRKLIHKFLPVLKDYKELIDLYTTLKQLNSMEGSGNEEESTQLLFLKEVLMDGCEWVWTDYIEL